MHRHLWMNLWKSSLKPAAARRGKLGMNHSFPTPAVDPQIPFAGADVAD